MSEYRAESITAEQEFNESAARIKAKGFTHPTRLEDLMNPRLIQQLRHENADLRLQLEAAREEISRLRSTEV